MGLGVSINTIVYIMILSHSLTNSSITDIYSNLVDIKCYKIKVSYSIVSGCNILADIKYTVLYS